MSPLAAAVLLLIAIIGFSVVVFTRKRDFQHRNPGGLAPTGRPATDEDVIRLIKVGRKIEAIKKYREVHRVGLADAKSAVEDLTAGGSRRRREEELRGEEEEEGEIHQLIQEGKIIAAIRIYREIHGVGLAQAKRAVERMAHHS